MAKQEFEQGDSNVVVRNQVVYGALPQDVIDRMGDTTLALQTTEQNVLPAINELKSNLTDLEKYSTTEEVVVGKWIDGKTIYRKCFNVTTPASTGTTAEVANIESLNYENAISIRFVLTTTSNSVTSDGAQDVKAFIRKKVTSLSLNADCLCLNTSVAGYTSKSGTIIFEYTKAS